LELERETTETALGMMIWLGAYLMISQAQGLHWDRWFCFIQEALGQTSSRHIEDVGIGGNPTF